MILGPEIGGPTMLPRHGRFGPAALASCLAALALPSSSHAQAHQIFLDFDHDDDLATIQDISYSNSDDVTIILQVGGSAPSSGEFRLAFEADCCFPPAMDFPALGVGFCFESGWCNSTLVESCQWLLPVDPPPASICTEISLLADLRSDAALVPGQRYQIGKICLTRNVPMNCFAPGPNGCLRMTASGVLGTDTS